MTGMERLLEVPDTAASPRHACQACGTPLVEGRDRATGRSVRGCLGCGRVSVLAEDGGIAKAGRFPLVDALAGAVGDCFVCGTCGRVRCVEWRRGREVRALCVDCGHVMRDRRARVVAVPSPTVRLVG